MLNYKLRFLHSADLHLDSPFKGLRNLPDRIYDDLVKSTVVAFHRLIDLAIKEQVDFVLIVGDLFDQESSSIRSSLELKKGLERLNKHQINVYLSYGNHDYMMQEKAKLTFPPNTYIFPSDGVTNTVYRKDGQAVAEISGFSYHQQAVKDSMAKYYAKHSDAPYHIATLHGSIKSNQDHDHYAPFLIEDLKEVNADYWALGHIHKREIISETPFVVYPGNTQGRHMKEEGEKGCYLVEMNNHNPELQFCSLQEIIFSEEELGIDDVHNPSELMDKLVHFKDTLRNEKRKMVIRLTIHLNESIRLTPENIEDILDTINQTEEDEEFWIWFNEIKIHEQIDVDEDDLLKSNPFMNEVMQTIEQTEELDSYLEELERHPLFRRYMNISLDDMEEDIKIEAKELILRKLVKDR